MVNGKSQLRIKGRQWLHALVYWSSLVAGMIETAVGAAETLTAEFWALRENRSIKLMSDKDGNPARHRSQGDS